MQREGNMTSTVSLKVQFTQITKEHIIFIPLPLVVSGLSAMVFRYPSLRFILPLKYAGEQNLGCVAPSSDKFEKLNSNMSFHRQGPSYFG